MWVIDIENPHTKAFKIGKENELNILENNDKSAYDSTRTVPDTRDGYDQV